MADLWNGKSIGKPTRDDDVMINIEPRNLDVLPANPSALGLRCRQIVLADLGAVAELLAEGFPRHDLSYWVTALRYLKERKSPEGFPRFGYVLANGNQAVGVLLLIFSFGTSGRTESLRCNVSSWYVAPEFRNLAPLLVVQALRHKLATFINTSPAENTLPTIEAQGFQRFCSGVFVSAPALRIGAWGGKVIRLADTSRPQDYLPASEVELLRDHDARGCLGMILQAHGDSYPVVFRRRLIKHRFRHAWLPCAQLIYVRDMESIVRFSGLFGRYLALRGMPFVLIGANRAIGKLPGRFYDNKSSMYYRGPVKPRMGDLAYTEDALFGG
jgi:hypothetical protein